MSVVSATLVVLAMGLPSEVTPMTASPIGRIASRAQLYLHAPAPAPIPTFARLYGTSCTTCHVAAPKLNVLGEAFRLAGYRLPDNNSLLRRDEDVPLGAEPWRDLWPRAIWPSDLPGLSPFAVRIESDVRVTGVSGDERAVDFVFPSDLYVLAAAPLGESVSAFAATSWSADRGFDITQAKILFRDVVPGLPSGTANLSLGKQVPYLLTLSDRQTDRLGVLTVSWQFFQPALVGLSDGAGGTVRSTNTQMLGFGLPAIEVNGIVGGRLHYGVGLSQGGGSVGDDTNNAKDPYYRVRYKFGGLNLNGQYDPGDGPVLSTGGQLRDRSLIVEHFGYRGNESTADDPQGSSWSTGVAARVLTGPWDAGLGAVRRSYDRPYGTGAGALRGTSWFAKVEYMAYPWLFTSLKYDRLDVNIDAGALPAGFTLGPSERRRLAPGAVFLIRQNVRAIAEAQFHLGGDVRRLAANGSPDLFLRLDVIF